MIINTNLREIHIITTNINHTITITNWFLMGVVGKTGAGGLSWERMMEDGLGVM